MRFVILIPTIRPNTARFFAALAESFTYPTDVVVMRDTFAEREGHSQAFNWGLGAVNPARHEIAVKMDDDILLRRGWQDVIVQAFADIPKLGVVGLDLAHQPNAREGMTNGMVAGVMIAPEWWGRTLFRNMRRGNVWGLFLASPAALMVEIGQIPIIDGEKYPFFADAWYCDRVRERGYKLGYVVAPYGMKPEALVYDEVPGYVEGKVEDTRRIRDRAIMEMKKK